MTSWLSRCQRSRTTAVLSWALKVALMVIPGCKTADEVVFQHAPTAEIHKSWNLESEAVRPYRIAQVVAAPRVVKTLTTPPQMAVRLWFLSREPTSALIEDAQLGCTSDGTALHSAPLFTGAIKVDQPVEGQGLSTSKEEDIFRLSLEDFEQLCGGEGFWLRVKLREVTAEPATPLTFHFTPVKRSWIKTP